MPLLLLWSCAWPKVHSHPHITQWTFLSCLNHGRQCAAPTASALLGSGRFWPWWGLAHRLHSESSQRCWVRFRSGPCVQKRISLWTWLCALGHHHAETGQGQTFTLTTVAMECLSHLEMGALVTHTENSWQLVGQYTYSMWTNILILLADLLWKCIWDPGLSLHVLELLLSASISHSVLITHPGRLCPVSPLNSDAPPVTPVACVYVCAWFIFLSASGTELIGRYACDTE